MTDCGYILIHRSIQDDDDYFGTKFDPVRCWIDLLLMAEWRKERSFSIRGNKILVKRGQVAVSVRTLCERWGYGSNNSVIQILKKFEEDGRISIHHSKLCNVITIENYERYQINANGITGEFVIQEADCQDVTCQDVTKEKRKQTAQQNAQQNAHQTAQQNAHQTAQPLIHSNTVYSALSSLRSDNALSFSAEKDAMAEQQEEDLFEPIKQEPKEPIDYGRFMEFFNKSVENCRIPSISKMTERRMSAINARINEYGKVALRTVIEKAIKSSFLNGGGSQAFVADFDWIFRPNNFPKVLEGNYDNRDIKTNKNGKQETTPTDSRRRIEATATSAEDYKTGF